MAQLTRTWWGQRFIEALERFTDPGRLSRGRSYARNDRILSHSLSKGVVSARIEGNINPYFGVYEIPIYKTTIQLTPIALTKWRRIIQHLASKASHVSQLLLHQMPEGIDEDCVRLGAPLLPRKDDFKTRCSCPDYANPCKHVAGLCYFLAGQLDRDPFLLFELRGLEREQLQQELLNTPLGQALAQTLQTTDAPLQPVDSYYTRPRAEAVKDINYERYWYGEKRLSSSLEPLPPPGVTAVLIKKAGDYPPFWTKDQSFISVMSEFYERLRKQYKDTLS